MTRMMHIRGKDYCIEDDPINEVWTPNAFLYECGHEGCDEMHFRPLSQEQYEKLRAELLDRPRPRGGQAKAAQRGAGDN